MTNFEKNWDYINHRPSKKIKKKEESRN